MINQAAYDAWVFDQLEPGNKIYQDLMLRSSHSFLIPFPEHLIKNAPEEIDQQEKDRRNDEFLKQHGVV